MLYIKTIHTEILLNFQTVKKQMIAKRIFINDSFCYHLFLNSDFYFIITNKVT